MEMKSYPCHGWIIDRTKVQRGESITDKVMTTNYFVIDDAGNVDGVGKYLWFIQSGRHKHQNLNTGVVTNCIRGWNTVDTPHDAGEYQMIPLEDTVVWCFNETSNPQGLPSCVFYRLSVGDQESFQVGDKLFVMDGRLSTGSKEISSPRQVVIQNQVTLTALEDSLILKVA